MAIIERLKGTFIYDFVANALKNDFITESLYGKRSKKKEVMIKMIWTYKKIWSFWFLFPTCYNYFRLGIKLGKRLGIRNL